MNFDQIPAGKDAPEDIYVAIEIPANSSPIKYEIDKDMGGEADSNLLLLKDNSLKKIGKSD